MFYIIYATLEDNRHLRKKGQLSAYSVFNPGIQKLTGTFDAEQIEQSLRYYETLSLSYFKPYP